VHDLHGPSGQSRAVTNGMAETGGEAV
jgi:hypothetical protein